MIMVVVMWLEGGFKLVYGGFKVVMVMVVVTWFYNGSNMACGGYGYGGGNMAI